MEKLKPKLFSVLKTYTREQFIKDVLAGIIVAIIALPLSIALAIASGVNPERGLVTAVVAGFIISFLGGSRVQIGGPTAAFVIIIYGILAKHGMSGLITATILAGLMLIAMGLLHLGSFIKFIPRTITTGFTTGIAVGIFAGQIKDFLGLDMGAVPSAFTEKVSAYATHIGTANLQALGVGLFAMAILLLWPRVTAKIPGSLVAVVATTLAVQLFHLDVNTIGSVYGQLSGAIPAPSLPATDFATIQSLLSPAFTIAILAGIESLLSCVVSDGMIGSRHRSNMELIAQGLGNIASGLFGGIPATGAIARTAANVKNGGRTPVAGMVHAVALCAVMVALMPLAAMIPLPTLASVLFMVAYTMSDWREFVSLVKISPKSDVVVLVTTFALTVFFDLVVAIEIGMVLSALLFMKRMADVTTLHGWKYVDEEDAEFDPDHIRLKVVPKGTLVYEIEGPMFFGAVDKFMAITGSRTRGVKNIILRMRSVPAMDATALHTLKSVLTLCRENGIRLIFSHVQGQPLSVMKKAGFFDAVGAENFRVNINDALAYVRGEVKPQVEPAAAVERSSHVIETSAEASSQEEKPAPEPHVRDWNYIPTAEFKSFGLEDE